MRFVEESPTLFSSSFFSFLQKLIHIKPYTRTFRNNGHCPAVPVIMWRFSKGSPSPWNYCLARFLKLYPILCVDLEAINRYPEVLGDDGERQTDLWKRGKSFYLHIVGGWTDEVCIDCVITGWNLLYSLEESKGLYMNSARRVVRMVFGWLGQRSSFTSESLEFVFGAWFANEINRVC